MFIFLRSQGTIFDGYFQQDMHMSQIIWSMTMSPLCSWSLQSPDLTFANQPSIATKISGVFQHLVESMS